MFPHEALKRFFPIGFNKKILEKFYFNIRCRHGSNSSGEVGLFIGAHGQEKEHVSRGVYFNYTNMPRGPLPNPQNFRSQSLTYMAEPYDIRGIVSMAWEYKDDKETTAFSYVPMLRRVRRTSAAARSDPHMGGDTCTDDAYGYNGKNADMKFTYVGKKNLFMPFTTDQVLRSHFNEDGGFMRKFPERKWGFEVPGWAYFQGAPATLKWILRPIWIVEMDPKDRYYNYGRQILYLDGVEYCIFLKEIYDKSGEYWKKMMVPLSYHLTPDGTDLLMTDVYNAQDDRTRHVTANRIFNPYGDAEAMINRPYSDVGLETYTLNAVVQLSK